MTAWLLIIGVTEAGVGALPPHEQALMQEAHTIIGVPRRLAGLKAGPHTQLVEWNASLDDMVARILAASHTPTVILATGDPNWYGIGATLSRHLPPEQFALHPAPSSFQLAAARLHWPLQNAVCLSLHGRAVAALHPHVLPGNRILALTSDAATLGDVARLLRQRGYGQSRLTVLENLGGSNERIIAFPAAEAGQNEVGDFYVLAMDCVADAAAPLLPPVPGLPDDAFLSDGQLTKREVRAATLARLGPFPGALLWDVGAGCGSVAIEWMRAARDARAIAFERDAGRLQMIEANRLALGAPGLVTVSGEAPQSLAGQPAPDAVFIGGDAGNREIFDTCWSALKPGGRLVANAVTIEAEQALYLRHQQLGGDLVRMEVSVIDAIGAHRIMRPRMAVTQYAATKRAAA